MSRAAIMVGGPVDGQVFEAPDMARHWEVLDQLDMFGPGFTKVRYADSGYEFEGLAVFVVTDEWRPRSYSMDRAHSIYMHVRFSGLHFALLRPGMVTAELPQGNPLVVAFQNAWQQHAPKEVHFTNRTVEVRCGNHGDIWPCRQARFLAKPFVTAGVVDFER